MSFFIISICFQHEWLNQILALIGFTKMVTHYVKFNWSVTTNFHIAYILQTIAYISSVIIYFVFGIWIVSIQLMISIRGYAISWAIALIFMIIIFISSVVSHSISSLIGCLCRKKEPMLNMSLLEK